MPDTPDQSENEEQSIGSASEQAKQLPFGGEFSPGQVVLGWLLQTIPASESRADLVEKIRAQYFSASCEGYEGERRLLEQGKRAGNVVIGMRNYGILGEDFRLSPFGLELLAMIETPDQMNQRFAAHILAECYGMDVLTAVANLQGRGVTPSKATLSNELRGMGFALPQATTKPLILLGWLREAGVLGSSGYVIDNGRVAQILGTSDTILSDLDRLSQPERWFLRSLGRCAPESGYIQASDVVRYAQEIYHVRFPEDRWQQALLKPLEDKGWIELERGSAGRGSRSGKVRGTDKFRSEYVRRLLEEDADIIPPEIRAARNKPLTLILEEMNVADTYIRGLALEHLAVRLADWLDLKPKQWRLRSARTGGNEVDVIVEGSRLMFSRWQIQCKNTRQLQTRDLAEEVGVAVILRSQVVVLVTTGRVPNTVYRHARVVNESTAFQVVIIGGDSLKKIAETGPLGLAEFLNDRAAQTMRHKEGQRLELAEPE
jgi:hypothetical protein